MRSLFLSLMLIVFALQPAEGQDSPKSKQSGYLNLKMEEATKKKNPYEEAQSQAIAFFKALSAKINDLKNGNISPLPAPSPGAIHHMTGVYLFCTLQKGSCPDVLDALIEADLINARISKNPSCPILLSFWNDWQANDMEKRQHFLIPIGLVPVANQFSQTERPKYIKCADTIKGEISKEPGSDAAFFKARYGGDSREKAVSTSLALHETIASKIPDIFAQIEANK